MQKPTYQNLQEEQALEMQNYPQNIPVGQPVNSFHQPYYHNAPMPPHPYPVQPQNFMNVVPPPPPVIINNQIQSG